MVERIRQVASDSGLVRDVTDRLQQRVRARVRELQVERKALPAAIAALATEADDLMDSIARSTTTAAPRGMRSLM